MDAATRGRPVIVLPTSIGLDAKVPKEILEPLIIRDSDEGVFSVVNMASM